MYRKGWDLSSETTIKHCYLPSLHIAFLALLVHCWCHLHCSSKRDIVHQFFLFKPSSGFLKHPPIIIYCHLFCTSPPAHVPFPIVSHPPMLLCFASPIHPCSLLLCMTASSILHGLICLDEDVSISAGIWIIFVMETTHLSYITLGPINW